MLGANTQQNLRKYIGVIKDSTSVGLVKVNSDYKDLDIAVVKATNHYKVLPKEKHVRTIFEGISHIRPRTDVLYCIQALGRRLARTHNWVVAIKTLIVIHRALREVDSTFPEELISYGRSTSKMLNLIHFRDESSQDAWDYSTWIRSYALFLEERLECFRVLNYDIELAPSNTRYLDITDLLEHLPALQQLLFRLLECEPQGMTMDNFMIQHALKMASSESIKIYKAIIDGTINLTEKFFELQRHTAVRALYIYKRTTQQMDKLSEFHEICVRIGVWHGENFVKIEQPLMMLQNMETHVKNAVASAMQNGLMMDQQISLRSREVEAEEYSHESNYEFWPTHPIEKSVSPDSLTSEDSPHSEEANFLGLGSNISPQTPELDGKNAMSNGINPLDLISTTYPANLNLSIQSSTWDLDLMAATTTSTENTSNSNKPFIRQRQNPTLTPASQEQQAFLFQNPMMSAQQQQPHQTP